jgi:hypothetical protein
MVRLVAGLSTRRPAFDPRLVGVRFVVDKPAGTDSPSISAFHCQYHSTIAAYLLLPEDKQTEQGSVPKPVLLRKSGSIG